MKFIYIVRNPFDRIESHYRQMINNGRTNKTFKDFFSKDPYILKNTLYFNQIEVYLKQFPKNQFLVLSSEELYQNPQKIMDKVVSFLEIKNYKIKNKLKKHNAANVQEQLNLELPSNQIKSLSNTFLDQEKKLNETFNLNINWSIK